MMSFEAYFEAYIFESGKTNICVFILLANGQKML